MIVSGAYIVVRLVDLWLLDGERCVASQARNAGLTGLQEELPSDAQSQTTHESVIATMVELRLSSGQGTSDSEIVLVCDLWVGEGTLYDPTTKTEINVWFDR